MSTDLDLARDDVWNALGKHPVRRAMLGRERADAITRVALSSLPSQELTDAGEGTAREREILRLVERRVRGRYAEQCGFAFTTFLLTWAISAIVQALVKRWWKKRREDRT
jgi:hypothetical protein